MRTRRAGLTLVTALAVAASVLTACGGLKLADNAASQVFSTVGKNTGEIKVAASDVARKYHVPETEVAAVAGQVDSYSGWTAPQSSVNRMATIAIDAKNNKAISAGVDVACKWGLGEITTQQQFQTAVASATVGMLATDAIAFREATAELATRLKKIQTEGSSNDKVAGALFCYGYSVVPAP